MSSDTENLEVSYSNRQVNLADFYQTDQLQLSDEEQLSLTPILNSLQNQEERYEEMGLIATGGEKRITRVYDQRLDRIVAMAHSTRAEQTDDQEQFLREARLTANLSHPNIVPVYNMGIDADGTPFFSMELVPGDSLKDIIAKLRNGDPEYKKRYPLETLLNIFSKVCDAIAYAHSRQVIHLDLKPDNIRVGGFGEVFVVDWGLARVGLSDRKSGPFEPGELDADVLNDMTLSGTMKGTPGFMAPEQTLPDGEKSEKTDIYALGAILYMLLTEELPVKGDNAHDVIENTRAGNIVPPRRRKPERTIPQSLVAVALQALALQPEDRYDSVLELNQEITRYLTGFPTQAEHPGPITRLTFLTQRHRRLSFFIALSSALIASLAYLNSINLKREKGEAIEARLEAEKNFSMYLSQQAESERLGAKLEDAYLYTANQRDFISASSMIRVLEQGIAEELSETKHQNLLTQKAKLHFILQQFKAANATFEQINDPAGIDLMWTISKKYAELKTKDRVPLTHKQLAGLFTDYRRLKKDVQQFMYYHHMRRSKTFEPEEYAPLAEVMLSRINNRFIARKPKPLKLKPTAKGWHLDLSDTGYQTLSVDIVGIYRRNIIKPLNLYSLDISDTQINHPSELRGLNTLHELRMVGVAIEPRSSLLNLLRTSNIETIIIGKDDYPPKFVKQLRNTVQVIVEEQSPKQARKQTGPGATK